MKKNKRNISVVVGVALITAAVWSLVEYVISPGAPALTPPPQEATTTQSETAKWRGPHYIEIVGGCGPYYNVGPCLNMRSGPGTEYAVVGRLRIGVVLRVEATTTKAEGGEWYKVIPEEKIRYPERVTGDWYIIADPESVRPFDDEGFIETWPGRVGTTTKHLHINIGKQMLFAYDGPDLVMSIPISTGLEFTPTPLGKFTVYRKTPSRYMQGPIPEVSDQFYDLPGVPWNLYFSRDGDVIHGAYWHNNFGRPWSHGCVNLPLDRARELYLWTDLGTPVFVNK